MENTLQSPLLTAHEMEISQHLVPSPTRISRRKLWIAAAVVVVCAVVAIIAAVTVTQAGPGASSEQRPSFAAVIGGLRYAGPPTVFNETATTMSARLSYTNRTVLPSGKVRRVFTDSSGYVWT